MATVNFAGLASGIDTEGLIRSTSAATRQARVTPMQNRVQELTDTNDALKSLTTRLLSLRSQVNEFGSLIGGPLKKSGTSSDESVLTASAGRGTATGSYQVNVTQVAKNGVLSFNDRWPSATSVVKGTINDGAPAADRTIQIAVGLGGSQQIVSLVLSSTTTPNDLVSSFNAQSTKAVASLVNVGTTTVPSYALSFTSKSEGTQEGTVALVTPTGTELSGPPPVLQAATSQGAQDSQFTITGISGTITRSTNTVTDVVPGLSLNLRSLGASTITVRDDVTNTTQLMRDFVDKFNEIVTFTKEGSSISEEDKNNERINIFGPLASTRVDEGILGALRSAMSSAKATSGSSVRIFADLGVTTKRDGTLAFDETKFKTAVTTEPSSVETILKTFGDTTGVTGGTIDTYTRFNGLIDTVENANTTTIDNQNKRIAEAERAISQAEQQARARFARFESLMADLQNQQSRLSSALASLGR